MHVGVTRASLKLRPASLSEDGLTDSLSAAEADHHHHHHRVLYLMLAKRSKQHAAIKVKLVKVKNTNENKNKQTQGVTRLTHRSELELICAITCSSKIGTKPATACRYGAGP